jgi:hypothetical protein
MTDLHSNGIYGNYEGYLAQLFNPAIGGPSNPGVFGPVGSGGIGSGYGGLGAGAANATFAQQNPWAAQNPLQQQVAHPVQMAVQAAQQIAARQAVHAIQCAQALQQIVQHLATQQHAQQATGWQPQYGQGVGAFGAGQIGQAVPQSYGWGAQNPISQALQQQAMPQLAQYLATQQPGQFRHGWVN